MAGFSHQARLKRRLQAWHIFFIGFGGVVGIGFFQGTSKVLAMSGPGGALTVTILVGIVAVMVMEAICPLICIWPIPNAMVEFVRTFVDEDLGTAIGVLYWYTYCVTFSVLISTTGSLTDYWGVSHLRKTIIYIVAPLALFVCNALPVEVFGWVEFINGIIKLSIVVGLFLLMLLLNLGVGNHDAIGTKYIDDSVQFNPNIASGKFVAVSASIPPAIFAYIGVELLTTTAFEARDPRDMRLPARNIGWFTLLIYALTCGSFVANVFWEDQNLPKFFRQALTIVTTPNTDWPVVDINPNVHAAPLVALLHLGFKFLPGFVNICLIFSALSCANTALYVASRQLHGLTRSITVTSESGFFRGILGWMGRVEHRSKSPWPALLISMCLLYWLPFIKKDGNYAYTEDTQSVLSAAGSVSCILVWCSQCVAYGFFYHWREKHAHEIESRHDYSAMVDDENTGWLNVGQPYLSYLGAIATFLIVFFFNTASLWNGKILSLKVVSAFASPIVLLIIYLLKKFTRPRSQWKFWNNLSQWSEFEARIQYLNDLIFPVEGIKPTTYGQDSGAHTQLLKPIHTIAVDEHSMSEISSNNQRNPAPGPARNRTGTPTHREPSWAFGDLQPTTRPGQPLPIVDTDPTRDYTQQPPVSPISNPRSPPPMSATPSIAVSTYTGPDRYYGGRTTLSPQDAVSHPYAGDRTTWAPHPQSYSQPEPVAYQYQPYQIQRRPVPSRAPAEPQMLMGTPRHEIG